MNRTIAVSRNKFATAIRGQAAPLRVLSTSYLAICVLVLGFLVNLLAYNSIQPLLIGIIFLVPFILLFGLSGADAGEERQAYFLVYSIGFFWVGIAAIYAELLNDPIQLVTGDSVHFFNLATVGDFSVLSQSEILSVTSGGGVVLVWQYLYNFFSYMGFDKGRYIGITANLAFVSLSAVIGVKLVRLLFGEDVVRIRRFAIAFACCGTFWLFSALHNRDALVLFAVTLLTYFWIRFLCLLSWSNFILLIVASGISAASFALLRFEFVYVPVAMLVASLLAVSFSSIVRASGARLLLLVFVSALAVSAFIFQTALDDFVSIISRGHEAYIEKVAVEADASSLGNALIVSQPLLIRLLGGSIYMFIYPIPFWNGFQLEAVSYLFKSFQALFMYIITPLFFLAVWRIMTSKALRSIPALFLLFVTVGFTLSTAFTSLETRHFGAFLPALLATAMLPDLTVARDQFAYRILRKLFLGTMLLIHLAWIVLKFL